MLDQQSIVDADEQGRYLDALSLKSDSSIDTIRNAQVALVHRFSSQHSVLAAINHAAECAAEERCTAVNPIRVKRLVLDAALPQWGVPAQDVVDYLVGSVDLDSVISEVAQRLRNTGAAGDLELATVDAVLDKLQAEDIRLGMCNWYCSQVGARLNRAFGKAGALAGMEQSGARALRRELLVCRMKARLALSLATGSAHAQGMLSKIEACLIEVERPASGSASMSESVTRLRAHADTQTQAGRPEEALSGLRAIVDLCDNAESYFDLGAALSGVGQLEEALQCFEKAAELRGCSEDIANLEACRVSLAGRKGEAAFHAGRVALERGDLAAAVGLFRQATSCDGRAEYYHWLGRALAQLGRLEDALPFFEQAARLRGDQVDIEWLHEARTQLVRCRREAALDSARREAEREASASSRVQHGNVSTSRVRAGKLGPIHIFGVMFSALTSASAYVVLFIAVATGEAVGVRLLTSTGLLAASAGVGLLVARSLARGTLQRK